MRPAVGEIAIACLASAVAGCAMSTSPPPDPNEVSPMDACRAAQDVCIDFADPGSPDEVAYIEELCRTLMEQYTCPWRRQCAGLEPHGRRQDCWESCADVPIDYSDIERTPCIESVVDYYLCEVETPRCATPGPGRPPCGDAFVRMMSTCEIQPCRSDSDCGDGFSCQCGDGASCVGDERGWCEPVS